MSKKTFRYAAWVRVVTGTAAAVSIPLLLAGYQPGSQPARLALCGFVLLSIAALAETLISRIELRADGIMIVSLLARRFIARGDIESATWEKGCGVSLRLTGGTWARLPDLGLDSRDVVKCIHQWLWGQLT